MPGRSIARRKSRRSSATTATWLTLSNTKLLQKAVGNDIGKLEKWGSHVVTVVTDNGANMTAMSALPAMRYPGPIPLRCAAHSLQLVIKDMLLQPLLEVLQLGVQSSCERFQGS